MLAACLFPVTSPPRAAQTGTAWALLVGRDQYEDVEIRSDASVSQTHLGMRLAKSAGSSG